MTFYLFLPVGLTGGDLQRKVHKQVKVSEEIKQCSHVYLFYPFLNKAEAEDKAAACDCVAFRCGCVY